MKNPKAIHKQLKDWVEGKAIHDSENNRCVPDMSCCEPVLAVDKEVRQSFVLHFYLRNHKVVSAFGNYFLGALAKLKGVDHTINEKTHTDD